MRCHLQNMVLCFISGCSHCHCDNYMLLVLDLQFVINTGVQFQPLDCNRKFVCSGQYCKFFDQCENLSAQLLWPFHIMCDSGAVISLRNGFSVFYFCNLCSDRIFFQHSVLYVHALRPQEMMIRPKILYAPITVRRALTFLQTYVG